LLPYKPGELELAGEGVVATFSDCAEVTIEIPVLVGADTLVEDGAEEKLVLSGTAFLESSWSTSLCSLLTFSTNAFRFANSS